MISNQKGNELLGVEICMKLNQLFVELPTVFTTSLNNKMDHSSEAQPSQGAKETVLVTKQVRLVGKVLLIEIDPDQILLKSWKLFAL